MNGFAVDTNIISFMLRKDRRLQERVYREVAEGPGVIIPPIAFYEIKRGLLAHNATEKMTRFERLCDMIGVDDMDVLTLDMAARIYAELKKAGRLIEDSDILIAASCLAHGYVLVTNNTKHFENIKNLQIVDWTK
jgi:predicted nucleic acid-binding protein